MDRLLRFHVWEIAQQLQLLHKQTELTKHTIETFILVVDAANWGWRLATRDAFTYVRGMAEIDSAHFPERLGRVRVCTNGSFSEESDVDTMLYLRFS